MYFMQTAFSYLKQYTSLRYVKYYVLEHRTMTVWGSQAIEWKVQEPQFFFPILTKADMKCNAHL